MHLSNAEEVEEIKKSNISDESGVIDDKVYINNSSFEIKITHIGQTASKN